MDWVIVIVWALATGGYSIEDRLIGSQSVCVREMQRAATDLDTDERIVVSADCYRASWPKLRKQTGT